MNASALQPPPHPAPISARRTLLLLAAVFVLPFVIGSGLFWSGWRPAQFGNHGQLLQPARALPEAGLLRTDGRPLATAELLGKWLLVFSAAGPCDANCIDRLQQLQRVHIALNKEQSRLRRVFIGRGEALRAAPASFAALAGIFPDLVVAASAENAAGKRWDELMNGAAPEIYIVDPFGNVVLRFADTTDMRGVLKDLERLLKYSWIQ